MPPDQDRSARDSQLRREESRPARWTERDREVRGVVCTKNTKRRLSKKSTKYYFPKQQQAPLSQIIMLRLSRLRETYSKMIKIEGLFFF